MVKAIETRPAPVAVEERFDEPLERPQKSALARALGPVASLRLTVLLFVLSLVLVFCSTLAQMNASNWTVVKDYYRSFYVWVPFQMFAQFSHIFFGTKHDAVWSGSFPFPGGWVIGGLLLVNLLAAHAIRFKLNWKRAGILMIHSGLVVMMLGELVAGLFAVEAKMSIPVGDSSNYVDVSHKNELAITTSLDDKKDQVVVIPDSILKKGGIIRNELLPVDVEVVEYADNSDIAVAKPGEENAADTRVADDGRAYKVVVKEEESGTDTNGRDNAPAVRVRLYKRASEEALGTHFLSLWHYADFSNRMIRFPAEHFDLDGKTYTIEFRRLREYKPYTIHLKEFHHDVFIGTDKPRNFSSQVQLVDPEHGADRETKIWMNHPLRHRGETLYQSGYFPDDRGTILQVVRNPAWLLPYLSCSLVSLGMIFHFGQHLLGFLQRKGIV